MVGFFPSARPTDRLSIDRRRATVPPPYHGQRSTIDRARDQRPTEQPTAARATVPRDRTIDRQPTNDTTANDDRARAYTTA